MEFIELFETLQVQSMASTAECKKSFQILAAQHANELKLCKNCKRHWARSFNGENMYAQKFENFKDPRSNVRCAKSIPTRILHISRSIWRTVRVKATRRRDAIYEKTYNGALRSSTYVSIVVIITLLITLGTGNVTWILVWLSLWETKQMCPKPRK